MRKFQFRYSTLLVASIVAAFMVYIYVAPRIEYGTYSEIGWRSFFENPIILIRDGIASTGIIIVAAVLWEVALRRRDKGA